MGGIIGTVYAWLWPPSETQTSTPAVATPDVAEGETDDDKMIIDLDEELSRRPEYLTGKGRRRTRERLKSTGSIQSLTVASRLRVDDIPEIELSPQTDGVIAASAISRVVGPSCSGGTWMFKICERRSVDLADLPSIALPERGILANTFRTGNKDIITSLISGTRSDKVSSDPIKLRQIERAFKPVRRRSFSGTTDTAPVYRPMPERPAYVEDLLGPDSSSSEESEISSGSSKSPEAKSPKSVEKAQKTATSAPDTNHKVAFKPVVDVYEVTKDQDRPHRARKDRQIRNPARRAHVQKTIRRIGGHFRDRRSGSIMEIKPGTPEPAAEGMDLNSISLDW